MSEIGDKTRIAAVSIGDKFSGHLPPKLVRGIAAAAFAALGVTTLMGTGGGFRL